MEPNKTVTKSFSLYPADVRLLARLVKKVTRDRGQVKESFVIRLALQELAKSKGMVV